MTLVWRRRIRMFESGFVFVPRRDTVHDVTHWHRTDTDEPVFSAWNNKNGDAVVDWHDYQREVDPSLPHNAAVYSGHTFSPHYGNIEGMLRQLYTSKFRKKT